MKYLLYCFCILLSCIACQEHTPITPKDHLDFRGLNLECSNFRQLDSLLMTQNYWVEERRRDTTIYTRNEFFMPQENVILMRKYFKRGDTIFASNNVIENKHAEKREDLLDEFKTLRDELRETYPDYTFEQSYEYYKPYKLLDIDTNPDYTFRLRKGRCMIMSVLKKHPLKMTWDCWTLRGVGLLVIYSYDFPIFIKGEKVDNPCMSPLP